MRALLVVVAIGLLAPATAEAQDPSALGGLIGGKLGDQVSDVLKGPAQGAAKKKKKKKRKKKALVTPVVSVAANGHQTDFVPTQGRTMIEAMIGMAGDTTEAEKRALRAALTKAMDAFDAGPGKNNIAAAITYLLASCMDVAQGVEVAPEQFKQVAAMMDAGLAADAQFQAMSAVDKQVLYETCVVLGTALLFARAEAERTKNPVLAEQARAGAQQVLTSFNIGPPAQPTPAN